MLYSNHFCLGILVNNQLVKTRPDGITPVPFGSTYSIRLKNRHKTLGTVAKIFVDKENVSRGGVIVRANSTVDIHRRLDRDVAFKFVDLQSEEAKAVGKSDNTNGDKGVVLVHFYLEQQPLPVQPIIPIPVPYPYPNPYPIVPLHPYQHYIYKPVWQNCSNTVYGARDIPLSSSVSANYQQAIDSAVKGLETTAVPNLSDGCTVPGQATGQQFSWSQLNVESTYTALQLVLKGYQQTESSPDFSFVHYCTRCGRKSKRKSDKYCATCGLKFEMVTIE